MHSMVAESCVGLLYRCRNVFHIRQVHAHVIVNGTFQDLIVANKLLFTYVQHKAVDDAHSLFDKMTIRDPKTWSVMVGGFAKVGDHASCYATFREVLRCGVTPDNYTLPFVIRTCRDRKDLQMGRVIHDVVLKHG
ncbi:Tetratricopeptide-like helical domain superfamily, partial [Sesbania bispinosa]